MQKKLSVAEREIQRLSNALRAISMIDVTKLSEKTLKGVVSNV